MAAKTVLGRNEYEMMVLSFQENNGVNDTKIILELYLCRPNNDQHAHPPWEASRLYYRL